jgi:hypothetical protein
MFYFLMGLFASIQFVWKKIYKLLKSEKIGGSYIKPAYIFAPLLVLCALISNYYIRDFYISYNSMVYRYIKYSLQTGLKTGNIKRIHVVGTISPLNADIYSRMVTETALNDLGVNVADYKITASANRYFPVRMEESEYLEIRKRISDDDRQKLDKIYTFEPIYRQYYVNTWPSEEVQNELQRIFMLTDVIPKVTSPNTLIIDITWTTDEYYVH